MTEAFPKLAWKDFEGRLFAASEKNHVPLSGAFELTYRCNFACVHCYVQDCRKQLELSGERWCELVDEVAAAGTLWLTLTGGEPMLHPGFDAVYERAIRAGLLVTVFTNGSNLTEQRVAWLCRLPPRTIEVTLYGFSAPTYERVTGRAENFEAAVEGVRRAVATGLDVRVKTMVFDETLRDLQAINAFAEGLGKKLRFDTLVHRTLGRSEAPSGHRLASEQAVAVEAGFAEVREEQRRRAAAGAVSGKVYQCGAGRFAYNITPDGMLQLCTLVRDPRHDLAKVRFANAWGALGREIERDYRTASPCHACTLRVLCSTCPGVAWVETGDDEAPVEHLCCAARLRAEALAQSKAKEGG